MKYWADTAPGLLFVLACALVYFNKERVLELEHYLEASNGLGQLIYVLMLTLAVVLLPLTVMPIIPMASAVFGPLQTGFLSIIGWTIGASLAFLIARYLGQPLLGHYVDLRKYDEVIREISKKAQFMLIVLLRLTMPVDLVSYALGFSKEVSFLTYFIATLIGVSWFSFAFAYLGEALFTANLIFLMELGGVSVTIFALAWYLLRSHMVKRNR